SFICLILSHPISTLFPYTTLFRSQIPVLDNNPQSNLERTTTVPVFNGDSLARVLRPLISPQRMLGWSLGIVYLWFGALKLAHLSPVLELIRRTSPLLATAPFYNVLALSELVLGAMLLAGVWKRWTAASAVMHLIGTFSVVFSSPQTAFRSEERRVGTEMRSGLGWSR